MLRLYHQEKDTAAFGFVHNWLKTSLETFDRHLHYAHAVRHCAGLFKQQIIHFFSKYECLHRSFRSKCFICMLKAVKITWQINILHIWWTVLNKTFNWNVYNHVSTTASAEFSTPTDPVHSYEWLEALRSQHLHTQSSRFSNLILLIMTQSLKIPYQLFQLYRNSPTMNSDLFFYCHKIASVKRSYHYNHTMCSSDSTPLFCWFLCFLKPFSEF